MKQLLQPLLPFFSGLLFGLGLVVSGMTNPSKVQGFLDVGGLWDPSLAMVMGGAVCVALPIFQWILRRDSNRRQHGPVEVRLVVGSILFGIGWGLSGYCPGPALVVASSGSGTAIAYVFAMGVGMLVASRFGALELTRANEERK